MPVSAPIISSNGGLNTAAITLAEGIAAVTTVLAVDPEGTVVTYKIVGGADSFRFQIDSVTGALSFKAAPDFEAPTDNTKDAAGATNGTNTYEVIVEANDSKAGALPIMADRQTITVTITDVAAVTINGTIGDDTMLGGSAATVEADIINGNAGNDTIDGGAGADSMTGGTGHDVYFVDNALDKAIELAGGGTDEVFASVTYSMAILASEVERLSLTGTANINGTGNALNNRITGNTGNNIIDGGEGADVMSGDKGSDVYKVDNLLDTVTEAVSEGTDRVESSVDFTLGLHVENLTLIGTAVSGTGNTVANTIIGNDASNVIDGRGGNDIINGGKGADSMIGGNGNDKYFVDDAGDHVSEFGTTGIDLVDTKVSFTLGDGVENLNITAIGAIDGTGNELNNKINGWTGDNTLSGGAGNDILDGKAGIDTMIGGTGNDTFYVDVAGDVVEELSGVGSGTDTVRTKVSYDISGSTSTTGQNIENIVLEGTAANATGNALNNTLVGNASANTLIGNGGNDILDGKGGADAMDGGTGDDIYIVDNGGDTVTESTSGVPGGVDLVKSSVTITALATNVENVVLTGFGNINATGNASNNTLVGNAGRNDLNGGEGNDYLDGKAGADTMTGGNGNDTYVIDNLGDVVSDGGTGVDTIITKFTTTLAAEFENLTLTGTTVINGTGNASNNTLIGNNAANILSGLGGADTINGGGGSDTIIGGSGQDSMTGGAGADKFVFSSITDSGNTALAADVITDFSDSDVIDISAIDAITSTAGMQTFNLVNSSAINLAAGNMAWSISGSTATIKLFTDNDLTTDANMFITLTLASNQTSLSFDDFDFQI